MESVIYKGIKYSRNPEAPRRSDRVYFKAHFNNAKKHSVDMYLHRQIWIDHNGKIPAGCHIHHKDENPLNNDIDNLECLTPKEHSDQHLTDERREISRDNLNKYAREKAAERHKSEEGRKWHSEMAKEAYTNRKSIIKICDYCGQDFDCITYRDSDRFCSNNCKSAWRRKSGIDNETRTCIICGNYYEANKYSRGSTCSRRCRERLKKL